ncbi:hypothetical protein Tco_0983566 [Tanacetum coccineum]
MGTGQNGNGPGRSSACFLLLLVSERFNEAHMSLVEFGRASLLVIIQALLWKNMFNLKLKRLLETDKFITGKLIRMVRSEVSSEPTISPHHVVDFDLKIEISFSESDDEDYTVIYDNNLFSYKIISVNDLKLNTDNNDDKIKVKLSSENISIKPLDSVTDAEVDIYSHEFDKNSETNHDTPNWQGWFNQLRLGAKYKEVLEGVFYVSWWSLWNFRNHLLFANSNPRKDVIFDEIVLRSFNWSLARGDVAFAISRLICRWVVRFLEPCCSYSGTGWSG